MDIETILAALAAVHVLAVIVVNLTPTPKDNEWLGNAYKVIEGLAGILSTKVKQ